MPIQSDGRNTWLVLPSPHRPMHHRALGEARSKSHGCQEKEGQQLQNILWVLGQPFQNHGLSGPYSQSLTSAPNKYHSGLSHLNTYACHQDYVFASWELKLSKCDGSRYS